MFLFSSYFDNRVLNFFQLIKKPLLEESQVNLYFYNAKYQLPVVRKTVCHLLPLLDGIRFVHTNHPLLEIMKPMFREKFAQIRELQVYYNRNDDQKAIEHTMEWLTANNNEPKLLDLIASLEYAEQILKAIRTVGI